MPSVTTLKTMLQAQIAPGRDDEFLRLLTEADIRLLETAKWRWTRARVLITPVAGYVVLPAGYASILGAQVNGAARDIRAEEYEFIPDGIGDIPLDGSGATRLIDNGINEDGFRHYKLTGHLEDTVVVNALCHLAPLPLYDPDLMDSSVPEDASTDTRCPDIAALKLMMLGIIFEEANDILASRDYVATAYRRLDDLEKTQRGGSRQQVNFRPNNPGVRPIRTFR